MIDCYKFLGRARPKLQPNCEPSIKRHRSRIFNGALSNDRPWNKLNSRLHAAVLGAVWAGQDVKKCDQHYSQEEWSYLEPLANYTEGDLRETLRFLNRGFKGLESNCTLRKRYW